MLPDDLETLPERFVWARKRSGFSQVSLAQKLGVSQQSIEKMENGHVKKPKYLPEAAKVMCVPYEWLALNRKDVAHELNALLDSAKSIYGDDAFISPLLQSLEAAVKEREKK